MSIELPRPLAIATIGAVLCLVTLAAGCAGLPRRVIQVHAAGAGPTSMGGLPVFTGLQAQAGREDTASKTRKDAEKAPKDTKKDAAAGQTVEAQAAPPRAVSDPDGSGQAALGEASSRPAALPLSMVPARGVARGRVVASVRRLIGVVRSFDERSFLGHVLIINDALPLGESSVAYTAVAHRDRARKSGAWVTTEKALPGDVVVFPCGSGCGAGAADGLAAGFVEESASGTLRFIAYFDGEVRACSWGKAGGDAVRIPKVDGIVRTWP